MTMLAEQITKAIGAHGMWKQRLAQAIETGQSDVDVATVRRDDACEFGQWLLTAGSGPDASEVRRLHSAFHAQAAEVLTHALAGHKEQAQNALAPDQPFASASVALTSAMMKWKASA